MTVMPVIVRQRETGELVQRFVFPTTIADVTRQGRSARRPGGDGTWASGDWARRRRALRRFPTAGTDAVSEIAAMPACRHDAEDDSILHLTRVLHLEFLAVAGRHA